MRVTTRTRGDVTIVDLNGKITIGSGDIALRNAVHQAIESGATKVVINLHEVTTIDSSGVGSSKKSRASVWVRCERRLDAFLSTM